MQTPETKRTSLFSRFIVGLFAHVVNPLAKGTLLGIFTVGAVASAIYGAYTFIYNAVNPNIQHFLSNPPPQSSKLLARDGSFLYEIFNTVKRTYVPLEEMSDSVVKATVAIEDKNFYRHSGVHISSLIRSAIMDYHAEDLQYGGSTITQQLVKNTILTSEKSVTRKVAEIIWAVELEQSLTKEEILERYINQVPYGRNTAGIEAASKAYFGKSAKELTLVESAYLASLPQAPSLYNPDGPGRKSLDERKDYILGVMHEQGHISLAELEKAKSEKVTFIKQVDTIRAPYFVFWLKGELEKQFGQGQLGNLGLTITTSLDPGLQGLAESTLLEFAKKNAKEYQAANAALVAIDPKTGQVLSMVGGKNYFGKPEPAGCEIGKTCGFEPNTNVATSLRQPGSSFKPYVYVTAFGEQFKFTPATIVQDREKNFSPPGITPYIPQNYNGAQYGNVTVRKALAGSLNIAAVSTISQIGTGPVIDTLRSLGVTAPLKNCGLALALGSCELTLLEHTGGFATFANMGKYNEVSGVASILDNSGKIIFRNAPTNTQVIHAAAAYELVDIMTDNDSRSFIFGTDTPLVLKDRKVAAKTGTTQNWKDGWTVGFTPELAVGVWVGNNDGKLMKPGSDGVFVAAPLWNAFMTAALEGVPPSEFEQPITVSRVALDSRGKIVKPKGDAQKLEVIADYAISMEDIKPLEPRVLSSKPTISDESVDQTVILEPHARSVITKQGFNVLVYTGTSTRETTVDLYIDGKHVATRTSAPFMFTVTDRFTNGWHTITAKAVHYGLESSHSVRVRTFFNPPPINPRGLIDAFTENEEPPM